MGLKIFYFFLSLLLISFVMGDSSLPYFTSIPPDETINFSVNNYSFFWAGVQFASTGESYMVNDTRFKISSNGVLVAKKRLHEGIYKINVTINNSFGNSTSKVFTLTNLPLSPQEQSIEFTDEIVDVFGETKKNSKGLIVNIGTIISPSTPLIGILIFFGVILLMLFAVLRYGSIVKKKAGRGYGSLGIVKEDKPPRKIYLTNDWDVVRSRKRKMGDGRLF